MTNPAPTACPYCQTDPSIVDAEYCCEAERDVCYWQAAAFELAYQVIGNQDNPQLAAAVVARAGRHARHR